MDYKKNSGIRNWEQNGVYQNEAGKYGEMSVKGYKLLIHRKNEIKRRKKNLTHLAFEHVATRSWENVSKTKYESLVTDKNVGFQNITTKNQSERMK